MADKKQQVEYADREELDAQLNSAIGEILSAEEQAGRIIAQAETSVKAIQLDGATREREMRDIGAKKIAAERDAALKAAAETASAECERRLAEVTAEASGLIKANAKKIQTIADELFKTLGGDK